MSREKVTEKDGIMGVVFEHKGERGSLDKSFTNDWMVDLACFTRMERIARERGGDDGRSAQDLLKVVRRLLDL